MRVAHKVTDHHHLHDEQQWQAAMTTHWVHQLPTVGVDKHIIIFPKTWANHYTQSASWVSVAFPEAMGRLRRDEFWNHWIVTSHSNLISSPCNLKTIFSVDWTSLKCCLLRGKVAWQWTQHFLIVLLGGSITSRSTIVSNTYLVAVVTMHTLQPQP